MWFAFSILVQESLPLALYAAVLDGASVEEIAVTYRLSPHWLQERMEAVRLALQMRVRLKINPQSTRLTGRAKGVEPTHA